LTVSSFWTSLAAIITYQYGIVAPNEGGGGSEVTLAKRKEVTTLTRTELRILLKLKNEEAKEE
jgi:hypothetical protein